MSNSKLKKLKSGIKNATEVTLSLSSNVTDNSNDEVNFSYKFLLLNTQVPVLCKAFSNGSPATIILSKSQLFKIVLPGRFLGRLLQPLQKTG